VNRTLFIIVGWLIFITIGLSVWGYFFAQGTIFLKLIGIPASFAASIWGVFGIIYVTETFLGVDLEDKKWVAEQQKLKKQKVREEAIQKAKEKAKVEHEKGIESKVARSKFQITRACCSLCRSTHMGLAFRTYPPEDLAVALGDAGVPFTINDSTIEKIICLDCKTESSHIGQSSTSDQKFILVAPYEDNNPLTPYPEYRKWLGEQFGIAISFVLPELVLNRLRSGDIIIGSLDIPEIASISENGCRYFHVTWATPPPEGCLDITQEYIEKEKPVVNEFYIKCLEGREV